MVSLQINGSCVNCPYIDIDVDYIYAGALRIYCCRCIHEEICERLKGDKNESVD